MKKFVSLLLAVMLIIAIVPASAFAASTKTVYVSRNGGNSRINLRQGPGYDYEVTGNVARHNDKVTVSNTSGSWSKVKVNRTGKTGWIRTYYIDGTTKALGTGTHVINKKTKVYTEADNASGVKGTLTVGDTVKVYYTERDFAKVTVTGSTLRGWIPMHAIGDEVDMVPDKPASTAETVYRVKTNGSNLNVRSGPGTGFKVLNALANGTSLTILETSGSWRRIKAFNGVTGWVSANYLVKTSTAVAWVNTRVSNLNVRKGPGTNTAVLGSLPKGTRVTVYSTTGNWAYITSGRLTGYVSMNYLRF